MDTGFGHMALFLGHRSYQIVAHDPSVSIEVERLYMVTRGKPFSSEEWPFP